jgi:hypothetical protein
MYTLPTSSRSKKGFPKNEQCQEILLNFTLARNIHRGTEHSSNHGAKTEQNVRNWIYLNPRTSRAHSTQIPHIYNNNKREQNERKTGQSPYQIPAAGDATENPAAPDGARSPFKREEPGNLVQDSRGDDEDDALAGGTKGGWICVSTA